MIELPGEVSSKEKEKKQEVVGNFKETPVDKKKIQYNQVQFNTLQINQEIRNTYLKRNGDKFIVKWLHVGTRNQKEVNEIQE
jgi:hypothetical protein